MDTWLCPGFFQHSVILATQFAESVRATNNTRTQMSQTLDQFVKLYEFSSIVVTCPA